MSHLIRVVTVLGLLLSLSLLSSAETVDPVSAARPSGFNKADKDSIDAYIRSSMRAAHIPGLALGVVHGDDIVHLEGYGVSGPDGRPVTPQTPFILGSTSKSFTALAAMQLVEAGRIDLDAPVTRYLPWFRTRNTSQSALISVRHLLNQTSGLQTYDGRQGFWDSDQGSRALEDGVRELSTASLRQPPGQRYEYANENYNTLGLIVQAVSGTSYEDYVRSMIFAPLHMTHSAAALSDPAAADIASGHRYWLFWPVAFAAPYPRRMTPAGFLISSAQDMAHYLAMQVNGGTLGHSQLLSPQGIHTLHTPAATMAPGSAYGMGWIIDGRHGSTRIWHDGDVSNFHSHLRLLPDRHLGIVVLMNVGGSGNGSAIGRLVDGIAAALVERAQSAPISSLGAARSRMTAIVFLAIAVLWTVCSIRRPDIPLAVELCAVGAIWILLPASVHTPMAAIALFAPDIFAVLVAITCLAVGRAIARILSHVRVRRSGRIESGVLMDMRSARS